MKTRLWPRLGLVLVAALGLATLVACFGGGTITITLTNTVHGTVVNARIDPDTGSPQIAGVAVVLKNASGSQVATDTTASNGTFSFLDVDPGSYTISASLTGYAFIDKPVVVAGNDLTIEAGNVLGFSSAGTDISIIAIWDANFNDVDSYLTYPVADYWTGFANPAFTDPYSGANDVTGALAGFFPDTTGAERETVDYAFKQSTAGTNVFDPAGGSSAIPAIKLDVDVTTGIGPETVTIKSPPIPASSLGTYNTGNAANGLPSGNTYAWIGVLQYYVKAYGSAVLSTEGQSGGANVQVYVIQGANIKGRFTVPDYISIDTASVLRINMFVRNDDVTFYQFVPDIRIADYSGIRGLTSGPIVLAGSLR